MPTTFTYGYTACLVMFVAYPLTIVLVSEAVDHNARSCHHGHPQHVKAHSMLSWLIEAHKSGSNAAVAVSIKCI